jgi:hypothetical protein
VARARPARAAPSWARRASPSAVVAGFLGRSQARRLATRYEKTLRNYAAVVALGCALLWLRV